MANEARPEQPSAADKSANTWAMLCHLSALALFIVPVVGGILGPLIVWLVKKDEFPAVDQHGKEALNFQISVLIYALVGLLLCIVLIGIPLLMALVVFNIVMIVISSVNASKGRPVRYPLCIRFIK